MVRVKESFPFTAITLKLSPIIELSLIDCKLNLDDSMDPLSHLRTLELKNTSFKGRPTGIVYLNYLKRMLNPSASNLELLLLEYFGKHSL